MRGLFRRVPTSTQIIDLIRTPQPPSTTNNQRVCVGEGYEGSSVSVLFTTRAWLRSRLPQGLWGCSQRFGHYRETGHCKQVFMCLHLKYEKCWCKWWGHVHAKLIFFTGENDKTFSHLRLVSQNLAFSNFWTVSTRHHLTSNSISCLTLPGTDLIFILPYICEEIRSHEVFSSVEATIRVDIDQVWAARKIKTQLQYVFSAFTRLQNDQICVSEL